MIMIIIVIVITHADGGRGVAVFAGVCLCLFFSHDISTTDVATS